MRDVIFISITLGLFSLCVAYVLFSCRTIEPDSTDTDEAAVVQPSADQLHTREPQAVGARSAGQL